MSVESNAELNQNEQLGQTATFTDAQLQEAIAKAVAEKDEEYRGVIAKNSELLGEKKAAQEKAEEARLQRELALQESLKKSGDVEQLEKSLRDQHGKVVSEYELKIQALTGSILGSKKNEIIADLTSAFIAPKSGKLLMQTLVETSFDESGKVITNYKSVDGTVITTDLNEYKKYMRGDDEISALLKAVDSSGGSSTGSKSNGSATGDNKTLSTKTSSYLAANK